MSARASVLGLFVAGVIAIAGVSAAPAEAIEPPASVYPQASRVVVMSNLVGELGLFARMLRTAGLIDEEDHWSGGDAHLVILGNVTGWGQGVMPTLRMIRRLGIEAADAGGMTHMLLGPLEIQLLNDDLGIIPPENYADLVTDKSEQRLKEFIDALAEKMVVRFPTARDPEALRASFKHRFEGDALVGGPEFLDLIAPGTEMGDWLRSRNVVIRIGDDVYSHGGLSPDYPGVSLKEINDSFREELKHPKLIVGSKDINTTSPPWWNMLVTQPAFKTQRMVDTVLRRRGARALIVGINNGIEKPTRYSHSARVFFVESGMRAYQEQFPDRKLSYLDITGDTFSLVWDGEEVDTVTPQPLPPE